MHIVGFEVERARRAAVFVRPQIAFRSLLMAGVAGAALLASTGWVNADGLTFTWTGLSTISSTSYARAENWATVFVPGGDPVFDDDGLPLMYDDDSPVLTEDRDVSGPPTGDDNMLLAGGTPNISSQGWHVFNSTLTGGTFTIRGAGGFKVPGTYFVDGTLAIESSGGLEIRKETFGASLLTANMLVVSGGTAFGSGNLVVTGSASQSGGEVKQLSITAPIYTHSGGNLSAVLTAGTYALTSPDATSIGGSITATDLFDLKPTAGTAIVDATLSGTGNLVKSGASTVVLTNTNDFTGTVEIDAGTLELRGGAALADTAAISLADTPGATLLVTDSETIGSLAGGDSATVTLASGTTLTAGDSSNTSFLGSMTGSDGSLVKQGNGTLTLGGSVLLGALSVTTGTLQVGTGSSTDTASFDTATIHAGATLTVAAGATLRIRVPNNLFNDGTLTNNGIVIDDLANTGLYNNNLGNVANVTSNTGTINNNTPGVWTGDVLTNDGTITNNSGAIWKGEIKSNNALIANNLGGSWIGDVTNTGYVRNYGTWAGDIKSNFYKDIYNDGAAAHWTGAVLTNDSQIVNNNGATWTGSIYGNNNVIFNETGSFWNGDVFANGGGSNNLAQIDNRGDWHGNVYGNTTTIFSTSGSWRGNVVANAGIILNNYNDINLNPTGANHTVWNGDVLSNDSGIINHHGGIWIGKVVGNNNSILNDSNASWMGDVTGNGGGSNSHTQIDNRGVWTGDVASNAGRIINESTGTWTGNVLANAGTIVTAGIWNGSFSSTGTVKAQNRINGAFTNSGLLQLTGSLEGLTTITNTGVLDLRGNGAAQTLTALAVDFGANSVFGVDIDSAGNSDRVVATTASLGGTVRVKGMATGGAYTTMSHYTLVSAQTINGKFSGASTDLAFLDPRLSYVDPNVVTLDLVRNDQGFAQVGQTPNQKSAAAAAEGLGAGNPVYGAILWLTGDEAPQAFDELSGEAYASFAGVSVENTHLIAKAVTDHLDQAFDAVGDSSASVSGYAEPYTPTASAAHSGGLWGELYGVHSDRAAAGFSAVSSNTGGITLGLDGLLGAWRLGVAMQAGATGMVVQDLGTAASSFDYGGGLYAGTEWGDTRLSLGALYTRHTIRSSRSVVFPGFAETLAAGYSAGTAQAFGELSHEFDLGAVSLRPFAKVTLVRHTTDAFTESGGTAALSSAAGLVDATFTTLGFSVDRQFAVADTMLLTASGSMGWRHAFARGPSSANAFPGGAAFTVLGAPLVADMFVLSASLDLDVSASTTFDLAYNGQIGNGGQSHALSATWNTRF